MTQITPNYIELQAENLDAMKTFYNAAFGFTFTDYGPEYAAVEGGPVEIGIARSEAKNPPMPTFESDDLEASFASAKAAGAVIEKDIFAFPGGRRFECLDPAGNRIAIYQNA